MAVSRGMRRLLRVLEVQEEQHKSALEAATAELRRMEAALVFARERERDGRCLLAASTVTNELADRLTGLEEMRAAEREKTFLKRVIVDGQASVNVRRREFLAKRTERQQAETLMEEAEARAKDETEKKMQQVLDERFLARLRHNKTA
jgi:hypothetical protein